MTGRPFKTLILEMGEKQVLKGGAESTVIATRGMMEGQEPVAIVSTRYVICFKKIVLFCFAP